jgi:peptidoglycan/LPS O-acetylase OafA/YrhL
MKRISSEARMAVLFFLIFGVICLGYGFYDLKVSGSAPLVFPFAGVMLLIALIIYVVSRKQSLNDKQGPGTFLLLLVVGCQLLASCQAAQMKQPSPVLFKGPRMITDSAGWTYPEKAKPTADVLAAL